MLRISRQTPPKRPKQKNDSKLGPKPQIPLIKTQRLRNSLKRIDLKLDVKRSQK